MYELTDAYNRLLEAAQDVNSEAFEDTLQSITESIEDKAQGYAAVISELQGEVEKRKKEIERITKQKAAMENSIKLMKENLLHGMETAGIQKTKGRYMVSIRNNAPHAVITDENMIPVQFIKTVETIDKSGLTAYLKANEIVRGAHLEQGKSLQIR
jgi:hypothetical protein